MTPDQQADIKGRIVALSGLIATLQADLLMIGVYEEMGDFDSEIIGAKQAASTAMARIEENLTVLKGYCS